MVQQLRLIALLSLPQAIALQLLLLDDKSQAAVCLAAKVANSEIADYVRWTRLGPPEACKWGASYVKGHEAWCDSLCYGPNRRWLCDPYKYPYVAPLHSCKFTRGGGLDGDCHKLQAPWRLLVPLRDPYTKLLSTFHSKHTWVCKGVDTCFKNHFLPQFSTTASDGPAFIRYLVAIVEAFGQNHSHVHEGMLNHHFWLQAEECLSPRMVQLASSRRVKRIAVPIDRGGAGLDRLSEVMYGKRPGSNGSFSSVMNGPYRWPTTCYSPKQGIGGGSTRLLGAIARILAPSYEAIRTQFGVIYESEAALTRAAASGHARICTTYGLFARNDTNGTWQTLYSHSSATMNLPGGNKHALCCEEEFKRMTVIDKEWTEHFKMSECDTAKVMTLNNTNTVALTVRIQCWAWKWRNAALCLMAIASASAALCIGACMWILRPNMHWYARVHLPSTI